MTTHNFNLTQLEKEKIEEAISALHSMINFEGDGFIHLVKGYFELIYGIEKAKKIIEFLEKEFWKDRNDPSLLILTFNDGEFFEVHKDIKEIKELFTKQ
jgi:hypothetical protein